MVLRLNPTHSRDPHGSRSTRVWRGIRVVALIAGLSLAALASCSSSTERTITELPDDTTIGAYCNALLPTFCDYAINVCGASGDLSTCISNARPNCCQRACKQRARYVDPDKVEACLRVYGGVDGGVDQDASAGLSCSSVLQGVLPKECQNIIQIASEGAEDDPPEGYQLQ
ncbi:MAG: hypothetical protein U0165_14740 [Polyangiaceae bacterium]